MKCSEKDCNLEVLTDDEKCILHSECRKKKYIKFWIEIRKDLKNNHSEDEFTDYFNPNVIYKNIKFPKFEQNEPISDICDSEEENFYFENIPTNKNEPPYINSVINECNINFENCEFWEDAYFENYHFSKNLSFINCTFENDIFLNAKVDATIEFINCTFHKQIKFNEFNFNKNLTFDECILKEGISLINTIFQENSKVRIQNSMIKNVNFENTTFHDLADFNGSTFEGEINFERTTFKDISVFTKVIFKDVIDFKYTTFTELAQFKETTFEKKLDLEDSIIKNEINFLKIKNKDGNNLKAETIVNRETARIIKNSFEKQNNIIEANKFYALEMEKRQEELSKDIKEGKNIFQWIIFNIHKLSSEHSTNPLLALFWILIISLFYSYSFDFLEKQDFYVKCFEIKYLESWIYSFYNSKELFSFFLVIAPILGILIIISLINYQENTGVIILFSISCIAFYICLTKDFYLFLVAKNFNPFSIMTKGEDLTLSMLLYKTAIAYLIYQFIISIRQNTRRK